MEELRLMQAPMQSRVVLFYRTADAGAIRASQQIGELATGGEGNTLPTNAKNVP